MRNALVIGGAGFIGSNLCAHLLLEGVNVYSLDNYSTGLKANHVDGVMYKQGNAIQINKYSMSDQVNVVFHLGEYSRVEQSVLEPFKAMYGICGTIIPVIEYCKRVNAKLIYSASSTRYGDSLSPYSISKTINAQTVQSFCEYFGIDYAITYFYNVYGPNEIAEGKYATVVAKFLKAQKEKTKVVITSPGIQRRNFTHVEDIVKGLYMVASNGSGDGYGIGSPESLSIIELANKIGVTWSLGGHAKGNRSQSSLVIEKTQALGWKAMKSLDDYIGDI